MNFIEKVAPFLLLSVFSITQLHAIFPHVHHDHHSGLVNDTSDHHHDFSDFLIHLFQEHSHDNSSNEHVILTDNIKVRSKLQSNFTQTDFDYKITVPEEGRKPIIQGVSNILHFKSYLSSFSLRGPPSLV